MKRTDIFVNPIYETNLDLNIIELEKFCYTKKNSSVGRSYTNVGGYQSEDLDYSSGIVNKLVEFIIESSRIPIQNLNMSSKFFFDNIWFNINGYKDFNKLHRHDSSIYSGVFYVKTPPNSGRLVFDNPNLFLYHYVKPFFCDEFNNVNSSQWYFDPAPNLLIIFPSWLSHWVEPNLSSEDRISFSFNISIDYE
jgi:uncharacterized protein (TIGR02466 family)